MTQATVSRVRRKVRVLSFALPLLVSVALVGACAEQKHAEGDDCLKDQDCLSGYCVQLHCGAAPPYTDAMADAEGGAGTGPGDGASQDGAGGDAPAEATDEAGNGPDAPADGPDDTGSGGG